jgi:hypothetical protein
MTRFFVVIAVVIVLAAALATWLLTGPDSEEDPKQSQPSSAQRKANPASVATTTATPPGAAADTSSSSKPISVRLPEGTPVATVIQALRPAADSGDPRAACRLALELSKCADSANKSTPEAKAACQGVTEQDARKAPEYLWQAAAAGNVGAMSRYVRDPMLDDFTPTESAAAWAQYQQNAEVFLTRAVTGGDVMALYFASRASWTGMGAGARRMFTMDPYMAAVYGNAAMPLLDPRRQASVSKETLMSESNLPPDQLEKARAEGQRIRETYFAGAARTEDTQNDSYMLPAQCDK